MKQQLVTIPEIKLLGIMVRTNNTNEMDPAVAKIGKTVNQYHSQNIAVQIPNHIKPSVSFSVYTDYDSDEHGEYTYFIGEEVSSIGTKSSSLHSIIIPVGKYIKFTTEAGKMPNVVIAAWQKIWQMSEQELGGKRIYKADFEVYDHRAMDPNNTVIDLYIGIK